MVKGRELMQREFKQRAKFYLVIGLALILAGWAYVHFVPRKGSSDAAIRPKEDSAAQLELPLSETKELRNSPTRKREATASRRIVIRDIFAPLTSQPGAGRQLPENESSKVGNFKLKGVICGGRNPIAIINGQLVRTGETIGGYRVAKIGKKEVILQSGNQRLELKLVSND